MAPERFADRVEAGRALAGLLGRWTDLPNVLVLALPRGGVPVARAVANSLGAPLDLFLVRKLGVPRHEELAMGAIASGGEPMLNEELVRSLRIAPDELASVIERERAELERRGREYRGARAAPELRGRTVILVDDGLATGSTMLAAVLAVRAAAPGRIIVAVPVASAEAAQLLRGAADEVVTVMTPEDFQAVGAWYTDFTQTTDDEVRAMLEG